MKVIGAGLPRTATLSQKVALETLGFAPCYHMVNVIGDLSLVDRWHQLFVESGGNWDEVFDGFEASVDWPGSFFYAQLAEHYPDAKVLLSVRDGEAWEKSITDTMYGILYGDTLIHDLSSAWSRIDESWFNYIQLCKSMWDKSGLLPSDLDAVEVGDMARAMERYNDEVKATIPAGRLLVWQAADGWEPLCEFLEVPVPDMPFPRLNDSKMFADRIIDASVAVIAKKRQEELGAAETR